MKTLDSYLLKAFWKNFIDYQPKKEEENWNGKKADLDYRKAARNIIAKIGGKENVNSVRRCITHVRFRLKDESKANDEIVKNLEGVISVVHGGSKYMTIRVQKTSKVVNGCHK